MAKTLIDECLILKRTKDGIHREDIEDSNGPFVIATDYIKAYGEQLRKYIPDDLHVLGTDGLDAVTVEKLSETFSKLIDTLL